MTDEMRSRMTMIAIAILAAAAAMVMTACGAVSVGSEPPPAKETVFTVDGVKLISEDIARGDDERTYTQPYFSLSTRARLLVRYESMMAQVSSVRDDYPLRLRVFAASDRDAADARLGLKACPILKSWMMAANWTSAHPWRGGAWKPGGDIDESLCVSVEDQAALLAAARADEAKDKEPKAKGEKRVTKGKIKVAVANTISDHCSEARALCFDLSQWYRLWVRESGQNFGVALVADRPVTIVGDQSAGRAPRIQWFETSYTSSLGTPASL